MCIYITICVFWGGKIRRLDFWISGSLDLWISCWTPPPSPLPRPPPPPPGASVCVCLCLSVSTYLRLSSCPRPACLSASLCVCLRLSTYLRLSVSVYVSASVSVSAKTLPPPPPACLSVSLCLSVSVYVLASVFVSAIGFCASVLSLAPGRNSKVCGGGGTRPQAIKYTTFIQPNHAASLYLARLRLLQKAKFWEGGKRANQSPKSGDVNTGA